MGMEKSEIKAATLGAFSEDLAKAVKATEDEVHRLEGAADALKKAGKNIEGVMVSFKANLEEGHIPIPKDEVETAKLVSQWIRRCHGVTISMADQNTVQGLQLQGRIQGLAGAQKRAAHMAAEENGKAKALREAEDQKVVDLDSRRPVGLHPGRSIAQERKAEAQAQKAQEGAQEPAQAPEEPADGAQAQAEPADDTGELKVTNVTRRKKKKPAEAGPKTRRRKKATKGE